MPISLKELKQLYKECKQVLKYMKRLYKSGAALRMLQPRAELENAELMVKFYKDQIENYKEQ